MCTFLQTLKAAAATIYSTTIYQAAVRTFPPFCAAGGNGGSLLVVNELLVSCLVSCQSQNKEEKYELPPRTKKNARAAQRPRYVRLTKGQIFRDGKFFFSKNLLNIL